MKIKCKLIFQYKNKKIPATLEKSLAPDNYQFVKTKLEKNKIVSEIESSSIPSLCHTLEDYLECVGIAEKIANLK